MAGGGVTEGGIRALVLNSVLGPFLKDFRNAFFKLLWDFQSFVELEPDKVPKLVV